jgi:peptidoglycan-N-acetylglucosamine deacetylase
VSAGEAVPVCLTFDVDADQSWRVRRPGEQGFAYDSSDPGPLRDPRQVLDLWWLEVESAIAERRGTSFCLHPEVIGRAWAFTSFEQFVCRLAEDPRVRLARCVDVARTVAVAA